MQFDQLKRREFITLLGGAAAWPLAAHAQQRERMRRIGALMPLAADDAIAQARNAAFLQGLQQSGWTVGQNIQIEYRWSGGNDELTHRYAAELAALAPEVILASGSAAVGPLLQATRTVPIVFAIVPARPTRSVRSVRARAPGRAGAAFVDGGAGRGGNARGLLSFDYSSGEKGWNLHKDAARRVAGGGVLRDPAITGGIGQWGAV